MAPPRWWGWHQLDQSAADRLVADADLPRGALVLDVGAGLGAITRPLVRAGARVVAVEAHHARAQHLRAEFGPAIVVVEADAADLRLPRSPFHVVANPPFAITTALLRRLLQPGSRLVTARLVLPEHAVRRWSSPSAPARARWGSSFSATAGPRLAPRAFVPEAPVRARVLEVVRYPSASPPMLSRARTASARRGGPGSV